MKLLVSSVRKNILKTRGDEDRMIEMYHGFLMESLRERGVGGDFTLEICQARYEVCLADYTRFLAGM